MPGRSTTDAIFALRQLLEKYHQGQKKLHCVFIDLEMAYDRVPRKEVWNCMRHENEGSAREIHQDSARHVPEKLYPGQDCCGNH